MTTRVDTLARSARQRLFIASFLALAARLTSLALVLSLLWATFIKLTPSPLAWWWGAIVAVPLALALAFFLALRRQPSILAAAAQVDSSLTLRDQLSSALSFSSLSASDPFAAAAIADADTLARTIDTRHAIPLTTDRWWPRATALLVALLAIGVFVPRLSWQSRAAQAQREEQARLQSTALASISDAAQSLRTKPQLPATNPLSFNKQADALSELAREVQQGRIEPTQAATQAARTLSSAAADKFDQAKQSEQQLDAVKQALASTPQPSATDQSPLARALRNNDLAAARDAANELLRPQSAEQVSPGSTADELERLSKDLDAIETQRSKESERTTPNQPPPSPTRALSDALKSAANELREQESKSNQPPPSSESAQPESQPNQSGDTPRSKSSSEAKPDEKTAESTAEKRGNTPQPTDRTSDSKESSEKQSDSTTNKESTPRQQSNDTAQRSEQNNSERSDKGSESVSRSDPKDQTSKPDDTPNAQSAHERPEKRSESQGTDQQGEKRTQERSQEQGEKNDQNRKETQTTKPDAKHSDQPEAAQRPSKLPDTLPSNIPEPSPEGVKRLAKELEKLAKAQRDAQGDRRDAEDLQRRAQEMLDKLSPDDRRKIEQWGRELAKNQPKNEDRTKQNTPPNIPGIKPDGSHEQQADTRGGASNTDKTQTSQSAGGAGNNPPTSPAKSPNDAPTPPRRTEVVDARSAPGPSSPGAPPPTVAAQWLGQGTADRSPSSETASANVLEAAQRSAQQAIEDRTVPRRFDRLIERYFNRLPQRTQQAAPAPAPDAPVPSRDAP